MIAAPPVHNEPPTTCTPLSEENEQKLRIAMATLFGLDPIQLLLVQHLMLGGRLSAFGDTLRKTHEQIRRYRGSERAQAGMMRNAIFARAQILAPVLTPLISRDEPAPSGPRSDDDAVSTIKVRLNDEPLGDLFEYAGVSAPFDKLKRKTRR